MHLSQMKPESSACIAFAYAPCIVTQWIAKGNKQVPIPASINAGFGHRALLHDIGSFLRPELGERIHRLCKCRFRLRVHGNSVHRTLRRPLQFQSHNRRPPSLYRPWRNAAVSFDAECRNDGNADHKHANAEMCHRHSQLRRASSLACPGMPGATNESGCISETAMIQKPAIVPMTHQDARSGHKKHVGTARPRQPSATIAGIFSCLNKFVRASGFARRCACRLQSDKPAATSESQTQFQNMVGRPRSCCRRSYVDT